MDELVGSLQTHVALLLSQDDAFIDKALVMKEELADDENWSSTRSKDTGFSRQKGRIPNRSRGRAYVPRGGISFRDTQITNHEIQSYEQRYARSNLKNVQCFHCKRFEYVQSNCRFKDKIFENKYVEGASSSQES